MLFSKMKKEILAVQGMSCSHCEQTIEEGLFEIPGIEKVEANHKKGQVKIFYNGDPPDTEAVQNTIAELGYEVAGS